MYKNNRVSKNRLTLFEGLPEFNIIYWLLQSKTIHRSCINSLCQNIVFESKIWINPIRNETVKKTSYTFKRARHSLLLSIHNAVLKMVLALWVNTHTFIWSIQFYYNKILRHLFLIFIFCGIFRGTRIYITMYSIYFCFKILYIRILHIKCCMW